MTKISQFEVDWGLMAVFYGIMAIGIYVGATHEVAEPLGLSSAGGAFTIMVPVSVAVAATAKLSQRYLDASDE